jgi:hypothetical protein
MGHGEWAVQNPQTIPPLMLVWPPYRFGAIHPFSPVTMLFVREAFTETPPVII